MAEATFSSLSSSSLKSSLQQTPPGNPVFVAFDDKYRCVVCNGIVREAVQTPCGHRACEQCIFQLLHGNPKKVKCPAGEETCSFLVLSEVRHTFNYIHTSIKLVYTFVGYLFLILLILISYFYLLSFFNARKMLYFLYAFIYVVLI